MISDELLVTRQNHSKLLNGFYVSQHFGCENRLTVKLSPMHQRRFPVIILYTCQTLQTVLSKHPSLSIDGPIGTGELIIKIFDKCKIFYTVIIEFTFSTYIFTIYLSRPTHLPDSTLDKYGVKCHYECHLIFYGWEYEVCWYVFNYRCGLATALWN